MAYKVFCMKVFYKDNDTNKPILGYRVRYYRTQETANWPDNQLVRDIDSKTMHKVIDSKICEAYNMSLHADKKLYVDGKKRFEQAFMPFSLNPDDKQDPRPFVYNPAYEQVYQQARAKLYEGFAGFETEESAPVVHHEEPVQETVKPSANETSVEDRCEAFVRQSQLAGQAIDKAGTNSKFLALGCPDDKVILKVIDSDDSSLIIYIPDNVETICDFRFEYITDIRLKGSRFHYGEFHTFWGAILANIVDDAPGLKRIRILGGKNLKEFCLSYQGMAEALEVEELSYDGLANDPSFRTFITKMVGMCPTGITVEFQDSEIDDHAHIEDIVNRALATGWNVSLNPNNKLQILMAKVALKAMQNPDIDTWGN